jgi:hypothetical protein
VQALTRDEGSVYFCRKVLEGALSKLHEGVPTVDSGRRAWDAIPCMATTVMTATPSDGETKEYYTLQGTAYGRGQFMPEEWFSLGTSGPFSMGLAGPLVAVGRCEKLQPSAAPKPH